MAFVVNLTSGSGRARYVWQRIAAELDQSGDTYSAYFTDCPGDATRLADQAVQEGAELIVAVGGDGTLREVINGLDVESSLFGIIPAGTGNGFRRSCNIPGHWKKALDGLSRWSPRRIDIGIVNGEYFLNVVGIGFDAVVQQLASGKYAKIKGYPAYIPAFFEGLACFDSFNTHCCYNDSTIETENTFLAVVANGSYYGGKLCIAPQAAVDDGKLDICLIKKKDKLTLTSLALQAFTKSHIKQTAVITGTGTSFCIKTDRAVPVHIDGDVFGTLPAEINIKAAALKILAPQVYKQA